MSASMENDRPLRILILALGGEGGGVLMNWVVAAGRRAGYAVQASSVPGVAQRTGATSYYIEVAKANDARAAALALVPMPGRVDVVIASELMETAREQYFLCGMTLIRAELSSPRRRATTRKETDSGKVLCC